MATPPWLQELDGEEVPRLIQSDSPEIRVIAGPGAGKTTGLKRRIWRLLETGETDPESIFVGTFTRAITADLAEDLLEYQEMGVTVSTLHSHALMLLRDYPRARAGRQLRFLLEFEKKAMLYDVRQRREDDDRRISELNRHLKRLQAAHSEYREFEDARFRGELEAWLREHDAMLISEVVPYATRALEGADIPPGSFDHVIVDEYQDLTRCEQVMVELIWSEEGSLVVLGDDAQSIYDFRDAHPDGVEGFVEDHPNVEDIDIVENRRSGQNIVNIANLMMEEARAARDPMVPTRELAGETDLVHWPSVDDEVEGLAEYMRHRHDQEFLVLVPRKYIGYKLRDAVGADARTEFREQVLDTPLAEERFTLATLFADPQDRVATRSWLGFHWRVGSRGDQRNSPAYLGVFDSNLTAPELVEGLTNGDLTPGGDGQTNVRRRAEQLREQLDGAPQDLAEQIEYLFDPRLAEEAITDAADSERAARDLSVLRKGARSIADEMNEPSLQRVLEWMRYRIVTKVPLTDPEEQARIRIMTLHSAKGLEADVIVVAGAADEMIPGQEDRAEQRRLLYVAVTRARDHLLVSWPHRATYANAQHNRFSFDNDDVEFWRDPPQVSLSRTSLLPRGGPTPRAGHEWLQEELPE